MFVAIAGGCDGDRICQAAKHASDMGTPFQVVPTDGGQTLLNFGSAVAGSRDR
jgi:hypothetical protein